ncbi:hypothetical protein D3C85_1310300 [compost metagenome]
MLDISFIGKRAEIGAHEIVGFALVADVLGGSHIFRPALALHKNRPADMHSSIGLIPEQPLHKIRVQLQLAEDIVNAPEQYRIGSIDLEVLNVLEDQLIETRSNNHKAGIRVAFAEYLNE